MMLTEYQRAVSWSVVLIIGGVVSLAEVFFLADSARSVILSVVTGFVLLGAAARTLYRREMQHLFVELALLILGTSWILLYSF